MNWLIISIVAVVLGLIALVIARVCINYDVAYWILLSSSMVLVSFYYAISVTLTVVESNMNDKYDWYVETRLKYAEANDTEKEFIANTCVKDYNEWYEANKSDIENRWKLESVTKHEFDYIVVKGD